MDSGHALILWNCTIRTRRNASGDGCSMLVASTLLYMKLSINVGFPKWMVYNGKSYLNR